MTKKQFWQGASNWGFLTGAALFVVNLIGWGLKLEANNSWLYELLLFVVICSVILYTGRRNARLTGTAGYGYGRAVGFVFAMMMFAGIVYGVGRFLMVNFIARDYYDALNAGALDTFLTGMGSGSPQYDRMLEVRDRVVRWMSNPFFLIIAGIIEFVFKGGFLGLVLCAFVTKKPDFFTAGTSEREEDNESGSE